MYNPFEVIIERLNELGEKIANISGTPSQLPIEVISREELCMRLNITKPTAIRWEKKGKIPSIRIGSNVRYNWPTVIEALEKESSK